MATSLRRIGKKRLPRERVRNIIARALENNDDRVSVIVLASLIDVGLERAIKCRMRRLKPAEHDAIFGGAGPLSGLSAKIRMAYGLGVIGPLVRNDLSTINDVRNVFAHAAQNIRLHDGRLWVRLERLNAITHSDISSWRISINPNSKRGRALAAISLYAFVLSEMKFARVPMKKLKDNLFGVAVKAMRF